MNDIELLKKVMEIQKEYEYFKSGFTVLVIFSLLTFVIVFGFFVMWYIVNKD